MATEPGALAVRAWAEGTTRNWRRDLQRVGRTDTDLDAPSALAKHLTMLAAQGRRCATLRGVVSSVRIRETPGIFDTLVNPLHWAICKAADRAFTHPPPRPILANAHPLQVLDARTSGLFGTGVVVLACLGTALCWRVSEVASQRPTDLATPRSVAFYDQKTQRRWITARLSHWSEAWRKRLHAIVQRRPGWIPLFASTAEIQHALRVLLMGTMWHSVAWHAFRRLGAAALVATGAAMAATARWGRWKPERQAAEYATPPLDWEWELPALLPWPAPGGGATLHATSQMEIWPTAAMGGEPSVRAKDIAPIPIVISDSSDDTDDGVFGPAVQADGVCATQRHCQQPGTNSGSASGTRRPASGAPHSTRLDANQVCPPPKTTSRPMQVPGAAIRRGYTARDEPAGGAHNPRQVRRRTASAQAGSNSQTLVATPSARAQSHGPATALGAHGLTLDLGQASGAGSEEGGPTAAA